MSDSKIVSKQFVTDFETVASHYRLKELGEYEIAKQCARNDLENAQVSFALMAEKIRGGVEL